MKRALDHPTGKVVNINENRHGIPMSYDDLVRQITFLTEENKQLRRELEKLRCNVELPSPSGTTSTFHSSNLFEDVTRTARSGRPRVLRDADSVYQKQITPKEL